MWWSTVEEADPQPHAASGSIPSVKHRLQSAHHDQQHQHCHAKHRQGDDVGPSRLLTGRPRRLSLLRRGQVGSLEHARIQLGSALPASKAAFGFQGEAFWADQGAILPDRDNWRTRDSRRSLSIGSLGSNETSLLYNGVERCLNQEVARTNSGVPGSLPPSAAVAPSPRADHYPMPR